MLSLLEERERVVTKGFMEREMRYAQEMREPLGGEVLDDEVRSSLQLGVFFQL